MSKIILTITLLTALTVASCTSPSQKELAQTVEQTKSEIAAPVKSWKINDLRYEDDCVVCEVMVGDAPIDKLKGDTQQLFTMIHQFVKADTTAATRQALQLLQQADADIKFVIYNASGSEKLNIVIDPKELAED